MQRSQVEVIEMRVGKEDKINPRELVRFECRRGQPLRTDRPAGQANTNSRIEHRVRDDPETEEIDQDS